METVTLSSKGQLVIPSHIRATAHLQAGDVFEVRYLQGEVRLKPVAKVEFTTLDAVAGCLSDFGQKSSSTDKLLSDAQMHAAIKARIVAEDEATMTSSAKSKKTVA